MRKRTYLALLCTAIIIGLLISPVMAVDEQGEKIYRPFNKAQEHPDIDGNLIVWEDDRYDELGKGIKDIYLASVEEIRSTPYGYSYGKQITGDPASQERPSISGDYIVWQDTRHGNWDIYLYRRSTGEETCLTTDTGKQWLPNVCGNYAAWYDDSSGDTRIVLYDIDAGSVKDVIDCNAKTTIPGGTTEFKPALSENYVAWVEKADQNVYYYDIAAETIEGRVSTSTAIQSWPSLFGSRITWEDNRHGNPDIYMTDLDDPSGEEKRITFDGTDQVSPAISETLIAWEDKRVPARSIYMYDLSPPGEELPVVNADDKYDEHLYPAVSGNTIVWQRGREADSNLYIFVYEPRAPIDPVVTTIEVDPPTVTLTVGGTEQFSATAFDQNENTMTCAEFDWTCSNTTVGTVDHVTGLFTAKAAGTATVTAKAEGVEGTATVTVTAKTPVKPELTTITVTPTTAALMIGGTEQFAATAFDQFDLEMPGAEFDWACSNDTVGTVDNATGLFTAKAAGTVTVTAKAEGVEGNATVTVKAKTPVKPKLTSITVTPTTAALMIGGTEQFAATAFDQFDLEMPGAEFDWACSNDTVGTVDHVTGLFTAKAAGTATVTAKAGGVNGTATVTVTDEEPIEPSELTNISVTPAAPTLAIGGTEQFAATAFDQFGLEMSDAEFDWACSNTTVGTIDDDGTFTALAEGTTTVTATADNVTGTATVTVYAEESLLAKIVVVPAAATLETGDELEFRAVAFDRFGDIVEDAEIAWESSDPCVGTIDSCGVFTALDPGTATVTAKADGVEGTATVTVNCNDPVLTSIVVTPSAITLAAGDTATFSATALDQDGCEMPDIIIDWECIDPCIGTIDICSGVLSAEDCGTTTVTATSGDVVGTADVEVTDGSAGVVVSPSAIILNSGDEWQFTVHDLQNNAGSVIAWSCDDHSVGNITDGGIFTAICRGIATVTATVTGADESAAGTAMVTVRSTAPELARIEVSPSDFCIPAGNCLTLTAVDRNGCPIDEVTWESSDPCVGTIDDDGTFTALAEGKATLTAEAGGISGSACVTVEPSIPVAACIEVDPSEATLAPGENQAFTATVFDQCDNEMDWVRVRWSCSDGGVGTIDRSGLFMASSQGSTDVTARAGGVEETASVTVTAAPTPDPTQTPTNPGSNSRAYSDGGGDPGPTFFAEICENLRGGETHTFSGIDVTSVGSIAITASDNIPRLLMTVKETGCPNLAEPPGGNIYEYIEIAISWANPNQIGGATLTFSIPGKWLDEHGMAPEDVRLMRYVNGDWQILETEVIGEEGGLYRLQATTPGFSTFAIAASPSGLTASAEEIEDVMPEVTGTPEVTEEVTTEPTVAATTTPAAPLVYAPFLAPLAFLLWGRRKK